MNTPKSRVNQSIVEQIVGTNNRILDKLYRNERTRNLVNARWDAEVVSVLGGRPLDCEEVDKKIEQEVNDMLYFWDLHNFPQ